MLKMPTFCVGAYVCMNLPLPEKCYYQLLLHTGFWMNMSADRKFLLPASAMRIKKEL
jgi:hypothetical protein